MTDKYEHIHNATNDRLAEMLEPIGFDIALNNPEAGAILGEVCRRLHDLRDRGNDIITETITTNSGKKGHRTALQADNTSSHYDENNRI